MFASNLMPARITKDFPEKTLTITNLDPTSKKCWTIWWKKILFLEPRYLNKNACTLHICTEYKVKDIPSTIKTQMNIVLLLLFGRLGHQGNTENLCNFAKLFSFWGYFFHIFTGKTNTKLHRMYILGSALTNRLITCSWRQKLNSSIREFMNSRFLILKTFCSTLTPWIGEFFSDVTNRL